MNCILVGHIALYTMADSGDVQHDAAVSYLNSRNVKVLMEYITAEVRVSGLWRPDLPMNPALDTTP